MTPTLTCLVIALTGVELGYQPAANGGLELIVQIDPNTFRTLAPGDPISQVVPSVAQQVRPTQITVALGNGPLPHKLPAVASTWPIGPRPDAIVLPRTSAPPATAPIVPEAAPLPLSPVTPATAAMPVAPLNLPSPSGRGAGAEGSPPGPLLSAPGDEPVRTPPPSGSPVAPSITTDRQPAATPTTEAGASRFSNLPPINGGSMAATPPDHNWLLMCLLVIALAASNGYVAWLFWDARQRYLGLLSRTFAAS